MRKSIFGRMAHEDEHRLVLQTSQSAAGKHMLCACLCGCGERPLAGGTLEGRMGNWHLSRDMLSFQMRKAMHAVMGIWQSFATTLTTARKKGASRCSDRRISMPAISVQS